jgi:hypothetical protein
LKDQPLIDVLDEPLEAAFVELFAKLVKERPNG